MGAMQVRSRVVAHSPRLLSVCLFSAQTAPSSAITFMIYESTIKLLHAEPSPPKGSKLE